MSFFSIKTSWHGKISVYLFGKQIFSYRKKTMLGELYKKRYLSGENALTNPEKIMILQAMFKNKVGYDLNIKDPKSYNEKIQWMKLHYHDPLMTKCADKYCAREYIKEKIGEEYLIPLLGVWDNADDIDFDTLPKQFVLKVNWGSGQNIIVKDKSRLNIKKAKAKLHKWTQEQSNHYYPGFEWVYKNITPKIVCEQYLEQDNGALEDYRFFCFHGEPYCLFVDYMHVNRNAYDMNWQKLDIEYGRPSIDITTPKPDNFALMLELAKKLAGNFPHVRVDLYVLGKKVYVGELTFSSMGGLGPFTPRTADFELGQLIDLEQCKQSSHYVA